MSDLGEKELDDPRESGTDKVSPIFKEGDKVWVCEHSVYGDTYDDGMVSRKLKKYLEVECGFGPLLKFQLDGSCYSVGHGLRKIIHRTPEMDRRVRRNRMIAKCRRLLPANITANIDLHRATDETLESFNDAVNRLSKECPFFGA